MKHVVVNLALLAAAVVTVSGCGGGGGGGQTQLASESVPVSMPSSISPTSPVAPSTTDVTVTAPTAASQPPVVTPPLVASNPSPLSSPPFTPGSTPTSTTSIPTISASGGIVSGKHSSQNIWTSPSKHSGELIHFGQPGLPGNVPEPSPMLALVLAGGVLGLCVVDSRRRGTKN